MRESGWAHAQCRVKSFAHFAWNCSQTLPRTRVPLYCLGSKVFLLITTANNISKEQRREGICHLNFVWMHLCAVHVFFQGVPSDVGRQFYCFSLFYHLKQNYLTQIKGMESKKKKLNLLLHKTLEFTKYEILKIN